jgi:lytic murein transglycosylase
VADLKAAAVARGVSPAGYEQLTAGLAPDLKVLDFLDYQPEFRTPIWDYLSGLVDDERVADGQAMLKQWRDTLAAVAARYRVDPATVVAVWGVESNFGRNFGSRPLLTSLSTLSCYGRRQAYFRGEFFDALKIVDAGDVKREQLTGSWAGAFGHTQFMPSTFLRLAVDFDGDGRRDLVGSVPDALASTANFLKKAGWRDDEVWGYEVRLPAGFDASGAGRRNKQPLAAGAPAASPASTAARWRARAAPACCCPPAPRARPSWCSATSTRSTATTPPRATRWPSPTCPTACAAAALRHALAHRRRRPVPRRAARGADPAGRPRPRHRHRRRHARRRQPGRHPRRAAAPRPRRGWPRRPETPPRPQGKPLMSTAPKPRPSARPSPTPSTTPGPAVPHPRQGKRDEIGIAEGALPFVGEDIWNAYELSWLDPRGKPVVALAHFIVPAVAQPDRVQVLQALPQLLQPDPLASVAELEATLTRDLSAAAGAPVRCRWSPCRRAPSAHGLPQGRAARHPRHRRGPLHPDPRCCAPTPAGPWPRPCIPTSSSPTAWSPASRTGRCWWCATRRADRPRGLLRYIISFRQHNEFHEQCVERIFVDILRQCRPSALSVWARYTRRGGLDINPYRRTPACRCRPFAEIRQ